MALGRSTGRSTRFKQRQQRWHTRAGWAVGSGDRPSATALCLRSGASAITGYHAKPWPIALRRLAAYAGTQRHRRRPASISHNMLAGRSPNTATHLSLLPTVPPPAPHPGAPSCHVGGLRVSAACHTPGHRPADGGRRPLRGAARGGALRAPALGGLLCAGLSAAPWEDHPGAGLPPVQARSSALAAWLPFLLAVCAADGGRMDLKPAAVR